MTVSAALIVPDWDAPPGVCALMSTRQGGVSKSPWASLNIGLSVGDDATAVAENRQRVFDGTNVQPCWLHLVHGADVHRWRRDDVAVPKNAATAVTQATPLPKADAAWTDEIGLACTVTAADCLPVLFCTSDGRAVAAAHAGWRGLAAGVLENTVVALCAGSGCARQDVRAWLGPCIGPDAFEVGADVLHAFGVDANPADPGPDRAPDLHPSCFKSRPRSDGAPRWLANLALLARERLLRAGVAHVSGGQWCTVQDASRFFSYRRDGLTGRMVAAVWRTAYNRHLSQPQES